MLRCWRKYSRSDRLMRFRTAAPPAGRPMMIPRRTPLRLVCATWSAKAPDLTRRPTFSARLKSAALTSRAARGKRLCPPPQGLRLSGATAPWPGAASARSAQPGCSSAPEIRACVCVCSGSADTCVSSAPQRAGRWRWCSNRVRYRGVAVVSRPKLVGAAKILLPAPWAVCYRHATNAATGSVRNFWCRPPAWSRGGACGARA